MKKTLSRADKRPWAPFTKGREKNRHSEPQPPPPPSGAEVLEVPQAAKKTFGLNQMEPKAPEKIFHQPRAWRKSWPHMLRGGGGVGWDPPPSADACLSWQKVQGREANRRRHRLTEPTTKALCQPPPPSRGAEWC